MSRLHFTKKEAEHINRQAVINKFTPNSIYISSRLVYVLFFFLS